MGLWDEFMSEFPDRGSGHGRLIYDYMNGVWVNPVTGKTVGAGPATMMMGDTTKGIWDLVNRMGVPPYPNSAHEAYTNQRKKKESR